MISPRHLRLLKYAVVLGTILLVYLLFHRNPAGLDLMEPFHLNSKKAPQRNSNGCPSYVDYLQKLHRPYSKGPLKLPYQRPPEKCRTYVSSAVEKVINDVIERIEDPDLARLFENCLPNTLDTTILWHRNATPKHTRKPGQTPLSLEQEFESMTQTFIVTGDIHAEWLRDLAWQLLAYAPLIKHDQKLKDLFIGAINTQARYIIYDPYCNAFQPPPELGVPSENPAVDSVYPPPSWKSVFECKWELDSLALFLALSNQYYENTGDSSVYESETWKSALETILMVLRRESSPTFAENGQLLPFRYTFQRQTNIGSETLPLTGSGNPVNRNTKMIRSAFRPSDDACVFQLFVPANAFMLVQLGKLLKYLPEDFSETKSTVAEYHSGINASIYEFGVVNHPKFGEVFAYEVDGYNSAIFMDDANIPLLLALPDLGFINKDSKLYQNTRKMVLSKEGNPYYLIGRHLKGIGGPHVGYRYAWPMSLCVKIRTSDNDEEIRDDLQTLLRTTGRLGLMHEGVGVQLPGGADFTRSWFSWCNSEFGKTILDLAKRKPHLIFKEGIGLYDVEDSFKAADLI